MKKSVTSSTDKSDTTKLINCSCHNEYQDRRYKNRRVANRVNKAPVGISQWRCTVCGKVQ